MLTSHRELIDECRDEKYYPEVLDMVLKKWETENATVANDYDVWRFWNDIWDALPDVSEIRYGPFWKICDLAEGSYLDSDVWDNEPAF